VNRELDRNHISRIGKLNKQLETRVKKQNQELVNTLANLENINRDLELQIEKRKDIEHKFMKIQRLYDTVVHNFPNGVIGVLNRKMKYVLIDGKDLGEIDMPALGLTDHRIAKTEDSTLAKETISKIKKAFEGDTISFEVKTKDRFYSITAVPLPDVNNNINEVLCVLQNVTRQKEMEEGLMKALEQERELGDLKSRFVTMACHEFKTPLATILSSNFLLENYTKGDYEKEKLIHTSRIKRSVNNLTMILNEFLLSEKLEENQVEVVNVEVHIPKYIRELVTEVETLKQKDQVVEYHHVGSQQHVYLAPHILWSILTNLISNSLKYSGKGDTITLTTEIKNNSLTIFLKDHGIGIPPEEINYIFERFYRARNAVNFKGTGLGLHIVEKNIKLFNGSISVSSQLNVGTEFTVVLPNGVRKRAPEPTLFDNLAI
jgi:signal transduction histidine kinase